MSNSLVGCYSYKDSLLHRLDPRIKIILVLFFSIFLFLQESYFVFTLVSFFIALLIILSRIKLKNILANIKPFLFFFIFILLMYFLFSREQISQGIITVWRFLLLIVIAAILTFTTSISQLVYAIENLFVPLKLIGISPRNMAVMVSATIRFIPLLFFEANNIKDAQKSRGANLKKVKHLYGFLNNLLTKTFNKASNLADAIESRCYRANNYSHFKELKLSVLDYLSILFVILIAGVLLWIKI